MIFPSCWCTSNSKVPHSWKVNRSKMSKLGPLCVYQSVFSFIDLFFSYTDCCFYCWVIAELWWAGNSSHRLLPASGRVSTNAVAETDSCLHSIFDNNLAQCFTWVKVFIQNHTFEVCKYNGKKELLYCVFPVSILLHCLWWFYRFQCIPT